MDPYVSHTYGFTLKIGNNHHGGGGDGVMFRRRRDDCFPRTAAARAAAVRAAAARAAAARAAAARARVAARTAAARARAEAAATAAAAKEEAARAAAETAVAEKEAAAREAAVMVAAAREVAARAAAVMVAGAREEGRISRALASPQPHRHASTNVEVAAGPSLESGDFSTARELLSPSNVRRKAISTRAALLPLLRSLGGDADAAAPGEVSEEGASLLFAGKTLEADRPLSSYFGANDKSKAAVGLCHMILRWPDMVRDDPR